MIIAFPYVRPNLIIRKGDGVYAHLPGERQAHLLRAPPPEAFHPDPNMPDSPAFAHMGSARPHPKTHGEGHNGVGELLNMSPRKGQFGHAEFIHEFDGKEWAHLHGMDGVINGVGKLMEKLGADSSQAMPLVQKAIELFNSRENLDSNHRLPNVDSTEWRKIVTAPYSRNYADQTKTKDGKLITTFTNTKPESSPAGLHLESYAIPFHKELGKILAEALHLKGYLPSEAPMWVKYPYITPRDLHPSAYRMSGRQFGQGVGPGSTTPRAHESSFPEGAQLEASVKDIYSWEMLHHLPDAFFYKKMGRGRPPSRAIELAKQHMLEAFGRFDPDKIPDIQVPINTTLTQEQQQGTASGNYSMMSLKQVLASPELLHNMVSELAATPAFTFMFGRIDAKNSAGADLYQYLMDEYGSPEEGLDYAQMSKHVTHGPHVVLSDGTTLHEHSHANAAKLMTKLMLGGIDEDGVANIRNAVLENPADFRLNSESGDENLEHRRTALQGLADLIAGGFGHQVQRTLPENIPTEPLYSRNIAGYSEVPIYELPSHIFHHTEEHKLPTRMQESGVPVGEIGAPAVKPPESPALQTQTPIAEPTTSQKPVKVVGGQFRPQTEEQRAARAALGQADPASLRQVMGRMGVPIPAGTGPTLTPQEQRFQQTFGDPQQQLLSQYLRSLDESLPIGDRLMKAMEEMQKDEARMDAAIIKHIPTRSIHINDESGVNLIAKKLGLTSLDVRTIAHSTGDWGRVSKQLDVPLSVIKVVKVSMGGI